jgi:hypothetical protein
MKVKHNKKRNVGILFSQLSEYISSALVEEREKDAHMALGILKKHFVKGTQLHKEFRLFRALVTTSVPSPSLAVSIMGEAKQASRNMDITKLRQEKSALIKDINYQIAESGFYSRRVEEYKAFATVQTLLNNWRSKDPDISVTTKFEASLHEHLLKEKAVANLASMSTPDVNRLTVQIMQEKLQEKYGQILNEKQTLLLKQYVFSKQAESQDIVLRSLQEVRVSSLSSLERFNKECSNHVLKEQIALVREKIKDLPDNGVDDSVMSQYLTLMKLVEELVPGENNG